MSNIELDNFDDYRNYLKEQVLLSEDLWKLIFYSSSTPLDKIYEFDNIKDNNFKKYISYTYY